MLIGQTLVKKQIDLIIQDELKPILLCGPSGYGKTSFAEYISEKIQRRLIILNCATKTSRDQIIKDLIRAPQYSCVLFDEIHALPNIYQETLYTCFDKKAVLFNNVLLDISTLNFIGATTDEGSLLEPLLNRFTYKLRLDLYSDDELGEIIWKYLGNITIDDARTLGRTARGCPRVAISRADAFKVTGSLKTFYNTWNVSPDGFEKKDYEYLKLLKNNHPKSVSLKTIEQKLKMSTDSVINNIESFLVHKDLIVKSSRGRELTQKGFTFIEKNVQNNNKTSST